MTKVKIYLQLLREAAVFAIKALVVNRLRTLLSLLGITIGIFLIISVFTLVDSLENSLRGAVATLGDDSIFLERMPWGPEAGDEEYAWWKYMQRPDVTLRESQELKSRMNSAGVVTFLASARRDLEQGKNTAENASVVAVTQGFENFIPVAIELGRNFTTSELKSNSRSCVIGHEIANRLFPNGSALNRNIKISGYSAKVIGILSKEGQSLFGGGTDEWVFVPVLFARNIMNLNEARTQIALKPKPFVSFDAMENEVLLNMRGIRSLRPTEEKNFALNKSSLISQGMDELFVFLNIAGLIIGGFSILVGGFSIANIMFVTVRERTNIIGIQKALGAKQSFILIQFLFEAVSLCVLGGAIGLLLIYLGTLIASSITGFDLTLTFGNILVGLTFSISIGLISGVVPASMAARMEPVEAMRTTA